MLAKEKQLLKYKMWYENIKLVHKLAYLIKETFSCNYVDIKYKDNILYKYISFIYTLFLVKKKKMLACKMSRNEGEVNYLNKHNSALNGIWKEDNYNSANEA